MDSFLCSFQFIPPWSPKKIILFSNPDRKNGKAAMIHHTARQVNTCSIFIRSQHLKAWLAQCVVTLCIAVTTARVGPSVPRQERPARDGARVASIETGLAAAAAKLSHQVSYIIKVLHDVSNYSCCCCSSKNMCQQEEQQKTKKKKKSTKKKAIVIEEPLKISQDSSSPEHNLDSQDGNLTDQEFNTGTVKSSGGPQPMAPGVFLSHRRPSMSSPNNNNSTNSTSTNSSNMAKGDRSGSVDSKGESGWNQFYVQKL